MTRELSLWWQPKDKAVERFLAAIELRRKSDEELGGFDEIAYWVYFKGKKIGEIEKRERETCRHTSSGVRYNIQSAFKWFIRLDCEERPSFIDYDTRKRALLELARRHLRHLEKKKPPLKRKASDAQTKKE